LAGWVLDVPAGNNKRPVADTHGGFYLGDSQWVNATNMWLASLYASKERKTLALKAKSKVG
jgi:hypothetical protein